MAGSARGFTLIELMIVVVVIGILAAIAIPNFVAMQVRAKEGATKSNMHTFQIAAEDFGVQNTGTYAATAPEVAANLPAGGSTFKNAFDGTTGTAYMDQVNWARPLVSAAATPGLTTYADSLGTLYQIVGQGRSGRLSLVLTSN